MAGTTQSIQHCARLQLRFLTLLYYLSLVEGRARGSAGGTVSGVHYSLWRVADGIKETAS
jgi:hypothetical protein